MTSGFRVKPGMTAKSHCLTVFIEKFAVVVARNSFMLFVM
jgi:hypothetical protein